MVTSNNSISKIMSKPLIVIREFNAEKDVGLVQKLENNCEVGSRKKVSIVFDTLGNPLCRIKCYPVRLMLVAEMPVHGELVGVIQGCIKEVGACFRTHHVKMGCILGLRVSSRHRRMGIGHKLMKAMEEWLTKNDAKYIYLATEEDNIGSRNLFTLKCNYKISTSLLLFAHHIETTPIKKIDKLENINIKQLKLNQAISLYNFIHKFKDLYPSDIESILKENTNLGTWVCYFDDEDWKGLFTDEGQSDETIISTKPSSWIIFSIWNSCEVYKLQVHRSSYSIYNIYYSAFNFIKDAVFPSMKVPLNLGSYQNSFGFLLIYGLNGDGIGNRLKELTTFAWDFAAKLAKDVKDCKLVMTEVGICDPFKEFIPRDTSLFCVKDLWYIKGINDDVGFNDNEFVMKSYEGLGNVCIDPRDF